MFSNLSLSLPCESNPMRIAEGGAEIIYIYFEISVDVMEPDFAPHTGKTEQAD